MLTNQKIFFFFLLIFSFSIYSFSQPRYQVPQYKDEILQSIDYTNGQIIYHTMFRFETHSDTQNNFLYNIISATLQTQKNVFNNFAYINRYDVTNKNNDTDIFSWSIIRKFNEKISGTLSYSYTEKSRTQNREFWDKDRFSISANYLPLIPSIKNLSLTTSFDTTTDWSEGRTLSQKIGYPYKFNHTLIGNLSYAYAHSLNYDEHIYNQYSLVATYILSKKNKISAEYSYLAHTFSYGNPSAPENDSILRLSLLLGF